MGSVQDMVERIKAQAHARQLAEDAQERDPNCGICRQRGSACVRHGGPSCRSYQYRKAKLLSRAFSSVRRQANA